MGSVISFENCPKCKGLETYSRDYYYRTGEEYCMCSVCGYYHERKLTDGEMEETEGGGNGIIQFKPVNSSIGMMCSMEEGYEKQDVLFVGKDGTEYDLSSLEVIFASVVKDGKVRILKDSEGTVKDYANRI